MLGKAWKSSEDTAITTSGDAAGLHILAADSTDGYAWRTVASLSEPGFETDMWIGNLCVTGSGKRAVIAYAPRTFTNRADLADRGAFTAVVNLESGAVRKLPVQTSLAYFNPGCGPTEKAILTQGGGEDLSKTRLLELDSATGKLAKPIEIPGQLTSAVPTKDGIVAADSGAVVRVARSGQRRVLAPATGVPYRLATDADGGVVFAERVAKGKARVRRAPTTGKRPTEATTLATGGLTELSVASGRGGRVFVTGTKTTRMSTPLPASVRIIDVDKDSEPSLGGKVVVNTVRKTEQTDPRVAPAQPSEPQPVLIGASALATGSEFSLAAMPTPVDASGASPSPALGRTGTAGDPNDPSDNAERTCSVPRNDPRNQAMQPKPRQIEWAVDQAVRNSLTVQRPANWKNLGMPAYTPQGLFPPIALEGGGHVPAQIMLGITAQESNMWQAARYAVPGVTANPLIGNYYGIDYYNEEPGDDWTIRWDKADCGYGVTQVTDGMRKSDTGMTYDQKRAIALDFAANIAKGLTILQKKWNETRRAGALGMKANNGDASRIENWFFAVWAYNSGFHPSSEASAHNGAWGVGWLNNPVNPRYAADRQLFLERSYEDASHPQHWSYPEKVLGWAAHPIEAIETPGNFVPGYRPAWWVSDSDRVNSQPPLDQFCDATNVCVPGAKYTPNDPAVIGEPAGPCAHKNAFGQYDLKCWYHADSTWKPNCEEECGYELLRFDPGYAYQEDATSYPPNCSRSGLPSNAIIVDNLPQSVPSIRPDCVKPASSGTFTLAFNENANGTYPGKIDMHQIGSGFGGQFWMSNTHEVSFLEAVGTWKLGQSLNQWARVMVHLPSHGARTQQARYEIDLGGGTYTKFRIIGQEIGKNGWVSLGAFKFAGTPRVRLSNKTADSASGSIRLDEFGE